MAPHQRYATKQAKASTRRRHSAHERLARDPCHAPQAAEARHHALEDVGLPADLVVEIAGRFHSHQQLLGTRVGVMCPALCGCRTPSELCRVRGWDTHGPSRLLGALPTRSGLKRRRRLGRKVLEPVWRPGHDQSPATQSRWPWTWGVDDAVGQTEGTQLGRGGTGWRGQPQRVLSGLDGLVLVVVLGDGRWVVPVDGAMRRPDPVGPGAPCRDTWHWARLMRDERSAAWRRHGMA